MRVSRAEAAAADVSATAAVGVFMVGSDGIERSSPEEPMGAIGKPRREIFIPVPPVPDRSPLPEPDGPVPVQAPEPVPEAVPAGT
jgi:hypothetical protein